MANFNGTNMHLGNIARLSSAKSRSATAENVYGKRGKGGMAHPFKCQADVRKIGQAWDRGEAARELGQGWKVRPCIRLPKKKTSVIADIKGPGVIQHIWFTLHADFYEDAILRMYWDGERNPSVEAPIGNFFCNGFKKRIGILSLPINVNPDGGFNCFFPMPFMKRAKITIENRANKDCPALFYTVNYVLTRIGRDNAYFHAQYRHTPKIPFKADYVVVDNIKGRGHYVGTYMTWIQKSEGWWGEGEIKMFMDGDRKFPTIIGTGTEDYFGGAWCFRGNYSAPFMGYPYGYSRSPKDKRVKPGNKHTLYRFHVMDPVRFKKNLKVTMQAIGWQKGNKYLPLQDDISSVC
jgi:hypothetical protein